MKTIRVHYVFLVISIMLISSCESMSGPGSAQIESYIEDVLPDTLDVSEFRFENYMEKSGYAGRTSCKGILVLNADLYEDAFSTFNADLEKIIGGVVLDKFRIAAGSIKVYQVKHHAGEEVPFTAELIFNKQVDGWRFVGRPEYESRRGVAMGSLGEGAVLVGEREYQAAIQRVINAKEHYEAEKEKYMGKLEKFFSPDQAISVIRNTGDTDGSVTPEEIISIRLDKAVTWDVRNLIEDGYTADGKATWLKSTRFGNSQFQANETTPVRISGVIREERGGWNSTLDIAVPNRWNGAGDELKSPPNYLRWNEDHFKSTSKYGLLVKQKKNEHVSAVTEYKTHHILVKSKDEAMEIIKKLDNGADFSKLAKEKSTSPYSDLGWYKSKDMPSAHLKVIATLDKGGHTKEPVKDAFGWNIFLVEDKR